MKTLPIIDLCRYNKPNIMLMERLCRYNKKDGIVLVNIPEENQEIIEKILSERIEKENAEISKKIKQLNAIFAKELYKI